MRYKQLNSFHGSKLRSLWSEIEKGVLDGKGKFISIEDREDAICYALNEAKKGDVVLIAGKGAERYQEVLGIKKLYNDKDTVEEILRRKQN